MLWGLWHAPVILLGHNYPGQEYAGVGMMVLFCLPLAFLMAYVRVKTRTVWGPAVLHGIFNATGPITYVFLHGYNPLWGGLVGLVGILVISLVTAGVLAIDRSFWRELREVSFGQPVREPEPVESFV